MNLSEASAIYHGSTAVSAIYLGSNQIYPAGTYSGFCRLTLSDNTIVVLEGSGNITYSMISPYRDNLVKAEVGTLCTSIDYQAFYRAYELTEIIIANTVTSFGNMALGNTNITSLVLPPVTTLPYELCESCQELIDVTIPEGVEEIGSLCFTSCNNLIDLTLPSTVTTIQSSPFSQMQTLTCLATTPPTLSSTGDSLGSRLTAIYVPSESVSAYQSAAYWSEKASIIQAIPT